MPATDFAFMDDEPLKLMEIEDSVQEYGYDVDEPIIHLVCRNEDREKRIVEVEGFYPYFYISAEEFLEDPSDFYNDIGVRWVEIPDSISDRVNTEGAAIEIMDEDTTTIPGDNLVKVVTVTPGDVGELREFCDETWEADVFFTNRFLNDTDITLGLSAPRNKDRVHVDEIEPLEKEETPDVEPRVVSMDIEVKSDGQVPDTDDAKMPITAISAHDSYTDETKQWVLRHDTWDEIPEWEMPSGMPEVPVSVFTAEREMVGDFHEWVVARQPDILTGWNFNGFDAPYLINRSFNINTWTIMDYCPLSGDAENVFVSSRGSPVISGLCLFDMLEAYEKTQIHELESYSLEFVSQKELGMGKEEMDDIDEAWEHDPAQFVKYSIRDTQAVVEIEKSQDIVTFFDNIRALSGVLYDEAAKNNISIIDMIFLRAAEDIGIALPTSTKPERGWYHGAKVFDTVPGKHENVLYPDLSSLYPYLISSLNVSPETLFETMEEVREAGYTSSDVYTAYIDTRDDEMKKETDVELTEIYYLKSDVKEGFVSGLVDDLIDLKEGYRGTDMYEAVKRITNSIYGVLGDSNSFKVGFRLFDWRLAESVTLAGRMVLDHTADKVIEYFHNNGYPDAKVIGGDTDSVQTSLPTASGMEESVSIAKEAVEYANASYDEFMAETFDIMDPDQHLMEVELESYATACFFLKDDDGDEYRMGDNGYMEPVDSSGIKKKYSQLITWDEGEIIENPTPKSKGFQLVRSDSAPVTGQVQEKVLGMILREDDPKDVVYEYLESEVGKVREGSMDLEEIGIPSAIASKQPEEYGSEDKKPQPHIRGAKYANQNFDGEDISMGDKPLLFYVKNVPEGYPEVYSAETREDELPVDAIAVEDITNIPDGFEIDWEKMTNKVLKSPIKPITGTMNWDWDDIVHSGRQSGLDTFA